MKQRGITYLFLFVLLFGCALCPAQLNRGDSLMELIRKEKSDSLRLKLLNYLVSEIISSDPDSAILICEQSAALAQKLASREGMAVAYGHLGSAHYYKGNYPEALDHYLKALKLNDSLGAIARSAGNLSNIGSVYYLQQDYTRSLDYYTRALKLNEAQMAEAKRGGEQERWRQVKNDIPTQLGNIANVHAARGAAEKDSALREQFFGQALEYYFRALKMEEEGLQEERKRNSASGIRKHRNGMAVWFANLGVIYETRGMLTGSAERQKEMYGRALDYYQRALTVDEELEDKYSMAIRLCNIGVLHTMNKNYRDAEQCLQRSLSLSREVGSRDDERLAEQAMTTLYTLSGRHKEALEHYKRAMVLKDSLFNKEKQEEMTRREMNFEFEKKQALAKAAHEQRDAEAQAEIGRQKLLRNGFVCGFVLILGFCAFIFVNYRQKQKLNHALEEKNAEIEQKTKDILDSIRYAKRIQTSLLPSQRFMERTLQRSRGVK